MDYMTLSALTKEVQTNGKASQNHCGNQTNMAIMAMVETAKRIQSFVVEAAVSVFIIKLFLMGKSRKAMVIWQNYFDGQTDSTFEQVA